MRGNCGDKGLFFRPKSIPVEARRRGSYFPTKKTTYTRTIQDAAGNTQSRSVTVRSIVTAMRVEEYKNVFLKGDLDF